MELHKPDVVGPNNHLQATTKEFWLHPSEAEKFKTNEEWKHYNLLKFKRKVLGLCGKKTIKTLDEITGIMKDIGLPKRKDDVKFFLNLHEGTHFYYFGENSLTFTRTVSNRSDILAYQINHYSPHIK